MKTRFPFRLGTTSYILRDDILPNIHFLKEKVDSIELLLFESDDISNYPSGETLRELNAIAKDYDLTYAVHLPLNIPLGTRDEAVRKKGVATMLRAIDATMGLNPHAWDLHLEPDVKCCKEPILDPSAWTDACLRSLDEMKTAGADPNRIGIEVLEYDYSYIESIIEQSGYGICLDIGHVWYKRFNQGYFLENVLPKARHFHLHGFNEERDHKGLNHIPLQQIQRFIDAVQAQPDVTDRVVTIEVFSENSFNQSMDTLNHIFDRMIS